jgi:hypothetical protein
VQTLNRVDGPARYVIGSVGAVKVTADRRLLRGYRLPLGQPLADERHAAALEAIDVIEASG